VACKQRVQHPGLYHVCTRGNNKRPIFLDDLDRLCFVQRLNRVALRFGWTIHAYVVMGNHYHLVLEVGDAGLVRGMCELHTGYAVMFNRRHGRVNHLFGKRYWSDELTDERRFLAACRYVILNPVRAGLASSPAHYVWSSYRTTIGLALSRVARSDFLLCHFGTRRATSIRAFRQFCERLDRNGRARWQPP
jgi:REP element-mobilizing transposase RayT